MRGLLAILDFFRVTYTRVGGGKPLRRFSLGLIVLLAPLASDMSFAIEDLNEKNPGLFQSAGAYAQVYSMFNSGLAAGMMAGPPIASLIYSKTQLGNHEFGPSRHMRARQWYVQKRFLLSKTSKSSVLLWKQLTSCQILFTGRPCRWIEFRYVEGGTWGLGGGGGGGVEGAISGCLYVIKIFGCISKIKKDCYIQQGLDNFRVMACLR